MVSKQSNVCPECGSWMRYIGDNNDYLKCSCGYTTKVIKVIRKRKKR